MTMQVTGAATSTPISIEEFEQFIKRAFRALKPKASAYRGERTFELYLNDSKTIGIRVLTSIGVSSGMSAPEGSDAIRVGLMNFKKGFSLMEGKQPIVKRTQGWKDNLKDRIEDFVEAYESRAEDIEAGRYIDWNKH